jgi:CRP/FNR family transcriptional regulator, dissimilatory nitrate respiration regulator
MNQSWLKYGHIDAPEHMIFVIGPAMIMRALPQTLTQLLPASLHGHCHAEDFAAGTALFLTGEPPRWMYFVLTGEVVLERHGMDGQQACLQRCQGGFVGEASLTSSRYHCDGRSTLSTRVIKVPIQALRQALKNDGAFAERWIAMLSREVRQLRLQNERLSLPKVQDRLLHLIETEGMDGRYALTCSVKELARQLAVTHEALYRAIAGLVELGRIERWDGFLALKRESQTSPKSDAY